MTICNGEYRMMNDEMEDKQLIYSNSSFII